MKVYDLLADLTRQLSVEHEAPRALARTLLAYELNIEPASIFGLKPDLELEASVTEAVQAKLLRIIQGEPLAYILGEAWFYNRRFEVGPGVLIPRPDSEVLVETALRHLEQIEQPHILELCTGSACLVLSVLAELEAGGKSATATATDLSKTALSYAKRNRETLGQEDRLTLLISDLFPDEVISYDMILANPPYIDASDMATLDSSVLDYEPEMALAGGEDGLDFYRRIYREAARFLKPGAYVICEHGYRQGEAVSSIIRSFDAYEAIDVITDYGGRDRVTICRLKMNV